MLLALVPVIAAALVPSIGRDAKPVLRGVHDSVQGLRQSGGRALLVSTVLAANTMLPGAAFAASTTCVAGFCGQLPTLSAPSLSVPSLPSSSVPSISMPSAPSFSVSMPSAPSFSLPSLGTEPTAEEKAAAAAAQASAAEALAAKKAKMAQIRAERMAQEARNQSDEYIRMRANAAEAGFGSTVTVEVER